MIGGILAALGLPSRIYAKALRAFTFSNPGRLLTPKLPAMLWICPGTEAHSPCTGSLNFASYRQVDDGFFLFLATYIAASAALSRLSLVVPSAGYMATPTLPDPEIRTPSSANG